MEKTIKIFRSHNDQEQHEIEFWKNISGEKKLMTSEIIRANYWAMNNDTPGRLQRVYRIIKRQPG